MDNSVITFGVSVKLYFSLIFFFFLQKIKKTFKKKFPHTVERVWLDQVKGSENVLVYKHINSPLTTGNLQAQ